MARITEEKIVEKLRAVTNRDGLTAWSVANGVDQGNVSNILAGRRPMQAGIAKALGYAPMRVYERLSGR